MKVVLGLVLVSACIDPIEPPAPLRVEPAEINLDVELGTVAPTVPLHAFSGTREVTTDAQYLLDGAVLGTVSSVGFTSDGRTGGAASIQVHADMQLVTIPVSVVVHSMRVADGASSDAPTWFDEATDIKVDAQLEPGNDVMLPANLGHLDIDFAANDADVLHEITVASPYLDVRVYQGAVAGPRHVELTANEWDAIARTSRGESVDLTVRSIAAGPGAIAHTDSAHLAISDLDAGSMLFTGGPPGTSPPTMWRYDMHGVGVEPYITGVGGACLGCHVAISPDGKRIAAGMQIGTDANNAPILGGVIVDASLHTVIATAPSTDPWSTAAFEPGGNLVTAWNGALTLRDGTTGAPLAPISVDAPAAVPAVSADGRWLAYAVLDAAGPSQVGNAIRIQPFDRTTGAVGTALPIPTGTAAGGVDTPEFSSDGRWLIYSRTGSSQGEQPRLGVSVVSLETLQTVDLGEHTNPPDGLARWASPVAPTRADGHAATSMAWIAVVSSRTVAGMPRTAQLWMFGLDPATGTITRPFHLPGQPTTLVVCHSPRRIP
jgi:hypothetical protein